MDVSLNALDLPVSGAFWYAVNLLINHRVISIALHTTICFESFPATGLSLWLVNTPSG